MCSILVSKIIGAIFFKFLDEERADIGRGASLGVNFGDIIFPTSGSVSTRSSDFIGDGPGSLSVVSSLYSCLE